MLAGFDSSFDRPNPAQAAAARAAGIRVWGGYIGTKGGLGLATLWSQADFDVVRNAGMTPIGFCSGWDDPVAIRDLAATWKVLPCVDVETGIRSDGDWLQGWLDASGAGAYGLSSVHAGRRARFHIVAWYGAFPPACDDPQTVWPSWLPRPNAPLGWQFCGTHNEFGLSVDRGWYDDWFAGAFSGGSVGGTPMTDDEIRAFLGKCWFDHLHKWPDQATWDWINSHYLPGWKGQGGNPVGALQEFYERAAAEAQGNVMPVRVVDAGSLQGSPGPVGPKGDKGDPGPPAPPHTHPLTGTTGSS